MVLSAGVVVLSTGVVVLLAGVSVSKVLSVMQPCLLACHSCCSLMWGSCFLLGFLPFSIVSMLELAILKEASHATSILRL